MTMMTLTTTVFFVVAIFAMAVFLFSMAGIPPTAGFIAKYQMFYSAVQARETVLVVISVLCSAISVYYYLSNAHV